MPLRVLCLDDSNTLGYNDPTGNSYHRDLHCQLWTGGTPVAMIGSVQQGDWDNNHHDAWVYHTIDEIITKATPELTRTEEKPNVILLHAGTVHAPSPEYDEVMRGENDSPVWSEVFHLLGLHPC